MPEPDLAFRRQHLLGIEGLEAWEILDLLERADAYVELSRQTAKKLDLLRGLRNPFAVLGDLRVARLMKGQVTTVSDTNTLCGLFKPMAIEGCRHMPLVDRSDRVIRMISMWEAVSLFTPRRDAAS